MADDYKATNEIEEDNTALPIEEVLKEQYDSDLLPHVLVVLRQTFKIILRWITLQKKLEGISRLVKVIYVENACLQLSSNSAAGPDGVPAVLLRTC